MKYFLLVAVIGLGLFLRVYHFSQLTEWTGDQGRDLSVARSIVVNHFRPLVGAHLNATNFSIPPTYYYVLALFWWLMGTPLGVALIFLGLNVLSGILATYLVLLVSDKTTAYLFAVLFSLSAAMVRDARSIYQVYLVTPFFLSSWVCLGKAQSRQTVWWLAASIVCYLFAASIYPSPWLFLPAYSVGVWRFFQKTRPKQRRAQLGWILLFTAIVGLGLYAPQIVYEYQRGFPLRHLTEQLPSLVEFMRQAPREYGVYIQLLSAEVFNLTNLADYSFVFPFSLFLVIAFGILVIVVFRLAARKPASLAVIGLRQAWSLYHFPLIAFGFLGSLLFWENTWERLDIFTPFLLLLFTLALRAAFTQRSFWLKLSAGVLLAVFIGTSFLSFTALVSYPPNDELARTEQLADYVLADARERSVSPQDLGILYYTTYGYGNYNVPAVYYFLQAKSEFRPPFVYSWYPERFALNHAQTKLIYLVCRDFPTYKEIKRRCEEQFLHWNPEYRLQKEKLLPLASVVIFEKKP